MKFMKRVIYITIFATLFCLIACGWGTAAPSDYETKVTTGGTIEAKYIEHGPSNVSYYEEKADGVMRKCEIYYPVEMTSSKTKYPAVMFANGSGVRASRYKAVFQHLASWGFIVVGNEEDSSWSGVLTNKCLDRLLELNHDKGSIFYGKIDMESIGIVGHSQGGVAVFNAITNPRYNTFYKAAVALSPVIEKSAFAIGWKYDATKVRIPILILSEGIGSFKAEGKIIHDGLAKLISRIPSDKAVARRKDCNHPQMLYSVDGYVTAWLLWFLKGDAEAGKAFIGEQPELLVNPLYIDQQIVIKGKD